MVVRSTPAQQAFNYLFVRLSRGGPGVAAVHEAACVMLLLPFPCCSRPHRRRHCDHPRVARGRRGRRHSDHTRRPVLSRAPYVSVCLSVQWLSRHSRTTSLYVNVLLRQSLKNQWWHSNPAMKICPVVVGSTLSVHAFHNWWPVLSLKWKLVYHRVNICSCSGL